MHPLEFLTVRAFYSKFLDFNFVTLIRAVKVVLISISHHLVISEPYENISVNFSLVLAKLISLFF